MVNSSKKHNIYVGRELYGSNELRHYGTKGMKWGYADGQRVAGKRTAEEEMMDAIKNKNYSALQNQVNELAKAGHKPEEIQKMLNDNIAQNNMSEAYQKKDYNAIQDQVNKLQQQGRTPQEIENMLYKVQGLKPPHANPTSGKSGSTNVTATNTNKSKRAEYSKDDSDFDEKNYSDNNLIGGTDLYKIKSKSGNNAVLFEDVKFELPKGAEVTPSMEKKLAKYFEEVSTSKGRADYDKIQGIIDSESKSNGDFKGSAKRKK